ncbi:MAG: DUF1254 domain-containing protein [Parvibaculum sp.]|nr:DUF1254 domain-containing protein [Parvibaculum sp.]|tara:strand:+ start:2794 stop:3321 length:528 start_codon:yes stop_codon:yes gene_type:complete
MSAFVKFALSSLVLAAIVYTAALFALPSAIMSVAISKIGQGGANNVFIHSPLPTSEARGVVRPSPDLAYSVCIIDLSKGPMHISVPLTAPYTSVALYATNTDNYFVRNDRDTGGKSLDVIVVAPGAEKPAAIPEGAELVEAPSAKGLVLVRRVVESADAFAAIDETRKSSVCAPL